MKIIVKSPGREDQVVNVSADADQVEIVLDRRGEPWPRGEDDQLKSEWASVVQAQVSVLADVHQRSCGAIRSRLVKLSLIPWNDEFRG